MTRDDHDHNGTLGRGGTMTKTKKRPKRHQQHLWGCRLVFSFFLLSHFSRTTDNDTGEDEDNEDDK